MEVTRRAFLTLAATATALGLGGRSPASASCETTDTATSCSLPAPADAPFDTVVVLMMENRSFDHLLGWLPGANGRQQGLFYVDTDGVAHETWQLAPDFQGCHLRGSRPHVGGSRDAVRGWALQRLPQDGQGWRPVPDRLLPRRRVADSERAGEGLHDLRRLLLLDARPNLAESPVSAHRNDPAHRRLRLPEAGRSPTRHDPDRDLRPPARRGLDGRATTITTSR